MQDIQTAPLFRVDNLSVVFTPTHVLKEISFTIDTGEFIGIIGPNGSGKSTLLRAMAGFVGSRSGKVYLEGKDVLHLSGRELARRLAVVPQENTVGFQYTVFEVVLMGRSPHLGRFQLEAEHDKDIALNAIRRTNLTELMDRRIDELSGGERQRVMIARSLAQDTDILFLDEPTAHLDIKHQVEVLHLARLENSECGKTVVVVLHDLNLAAEFCDRLIMLKEGELFVQGTPDEVITAENVSSVYGASVWIRRHPTSGRPYVLSAGSRAVVSRLIREESGSIPHRVHVICGGGSGGPVLACLVEAGCEVTAGVINIGDSDQEAAETLGVEYVEDAPFSPISEKAEKANLDFIEKADAVIVAEMPFGKGNLANLHAAVKAIEYGKPVALIGSRDAWSGRDFTDGDVLGALNCLVEKGAAVIDTPSGLADWIAELV